MILPSEITDHAAALEVHPSDVQRDYVYNWLLAGIYTMSPLRDVLVLKGGNCFRKAYFPNGRFSRDLDFSTQTAIDESYLHEELDKVCAFVQEQTGVEFRLDRNRVALKKGSDRDKVIYEARLYFQDFFGHADHIVIMVRLDVTAFDRLYLPIQTRNLISLYSDAGACRAELRCVKLEELLASKLVCLLQRRHSLDLFDYVYSLFFNRDIDVARGEIVSTFFKKTIFDRDRGVVRNLLLGVPLDMFKGVWRKYLVCPASSVFDIDVAIDRFRDSIQDLFGPFGTRRSPGTFFPAELRNTIMDAAASLTLLRITYDGYTREVEPYSLTYKTRNDGLGREYFYVWDRTGGRSRQIGIKSFLGHKVVSLEPTDTPFDPRFPVELSKHAEAERAGYFAKSFTGRPRVVRGTVRRSRRSRSITAVAQPKYTIECPVCGKRFRRKKNRTQLNEHKDKFGNRCFGRQGYFVSYG